MEFYGTSDGSLINPAHIVSIDNKGVARMVDGQQHVIASSTSEISDQIERVRVDYSGDIGQVADAIHDGLKEVAERIHNAT